MAMGEAASDSDRTGRERLRETRELNVEPQNEDSTLISEQTDDSSDRFPNATSLGTIATGQGSEFSQDIDGWESYMGEEKIEEDSQLELLGAVLIEARDRPAGTDRHNSRVVREICLDSNGSLDASSGRDRVGSLSADSETRRSETPAQRKSFRRDPRNAAHDANETSKQKGLSRASNRLGGQDLSIVRDNFHEMGGRIARAKHKRTSSEPSPPPTFVVSKRTKAGSAWTTSANKKTLKSADDAKNVRKDKLTNQWSERNAAKAAEALLERRAAELDESRRQFDERMKLDREEARERHQQMMLVLTAMILKANTKPNEM
ncbi:hypothetical protein L916_02637 [Phytophthora nicotianae]|uniref:Uncharacterized protein n=1 Tax=Phytophthora nicotianae TaxID=4792 RepID=W2JPJ5_PHYNI|nr:hypothetical protein L916_02637 [Phytophthora nicotianae]